MNSKNSGVKIRMKEIVERQSEELVNRLISLSTQCKHEIQREWPRRIIEKIIYVIYFDQGTINDLSKEFYELGFKWATILQ